MATYYIDPTGNDTTGTGSVGSPWKTLYKATSTVITSGNTIHINAGTYVETLMSTLAVGVNLEGDNSGTTILKNSRTTNFSTPGGEFQNILAASAEGTSGAQYIRNLQFDGQMINYWGVYVAGRSNVDIYNCEYYNFVDRGCIMGGRNDNSNTAPTIYATGNTFHDNIMDNCAQYDQALGYGAGCLNIGGQEGMLIYGNTITQDSRAAGYNGWCIKYYNEGFLKGLKIYNNTFNKIPNSFAEGDNNWDFAVELFNQYGFEAYGNILNGGSIDINHTTKDVYAYGAWIHNNVFTQPVQSAYMQTVVTVEFESDTIIIENNTADKFSHGVIFTPRPGDTVQNITIQNNLITNIGMAEGTGFAVYLGAPGNGTFNNINIYNNTFLEYSGAPTWWGISLPNLTSGTIGNINIKNNIMDGALSGAVVQQGGSVAITNLNISYNNFFGNGTNDLVLDGGAPTPGSGYVNSNNLSVNPSFGAGYALVTGSTLVDAGINVGLPYSGSAPNINWIETTVAPPPVVCNSWNTAAVANGATISGGNLTVTGVDYTTGTQLANATVTSGTKKAWKYTVNTISTADNNFGLEFGISNGISTSTGSYAGFDDSGSSWVLANDGQGYHTAYVGSTSVTTGPVCTTGTEILLTLDQTGVLAVLQAYKKVTGVWTLLGTVYNDIPLGTYYPLVCFRQGASVTADFASTDLISGFSSPCDIPTLYMKRKFVILP